MRWGRLAARNRELRYEYRILVGKHEANRLDGRPRRRSEYNIKTRSSGKN
jgi:hypothetical protein